jgi:hypothetical protein
MENLPEDLQIVLIETLCSISVVSVKVFAHVNKFCYWLSRKCAIKYNIYRPLNCYEIVVEGSLEVLNWAMPNRNYSCNYIMCEVAARNGHLHILEWLRMNNCYYDSWSVSAYAADNGYCHILEWIHLNGLSKSNFLCSRAASRGHLNILKWAQSINYCDADSYGVCAKAINNGHFEVVKWAYSNGYPMTPDTYGLAKLMWPEFFQ